MVRRSFFVAFALAVFVWAALAAGFIWTVDPYGVSPIHYEQAGFNEQKPKRIDIDRLIKPYEVWRYQPRTIFLGTSRIHESIDPRVLDGTRYAPAYNAAIPANTLSENAATIEQYFRLDRRLKYVFIELFPVNFLMPGPVEPQASVLSAFEKIVPLQFSTAALFASYDTIAFNQTAAAHPIGPYISPQGFWVRPAGFDTATTFDAQRHSDAIAQIHKKIPLMLLQPTTFGDLDRIVAACDKHDARLVMFVTPSYPWEEYRLLSLGYWPLLEEWLRRLAAYKNVVSFAQMNALTEEAAGKDMRYWNDPIHFGMPFGRLMLRAFLGDQDPGMPANFMRRLDRGTVDDVIRERRAGVEHWAAAHPDFVRIFEAAKHAAGVGDHPGEDGGGGESGGGGAAAASGK